MTNRQGDRARQAAVDVGADAGRAPLRAGKVLAPRTRRDGLPGAILRLVLAATVLMSLAGLFAVSMVEALLPVYRVAFERVAPDFRVTAFRAGAEGAHRVVAVTVRLKDAVFVGTRLVFPDPRGEASASTPLSHALQTPAVACLVVLAWPLAGRVRKSFALALALLLAAPLMVFDVPIVLAATLWRTVVDVVAPGTESWLFPCSAFLLGGGRWVLGALAGVFAVAALRHRAVPGNRLGIGGSGRDP